jgi:hypothetical protein
MPKTKVPMPVATPEEEELERKLAELAAVEGELAQRDLDLATLAAELEAFERLYIRVVGWKYAELDKISAEIQQLLFSRNPGDPEARRRAQDAQEQARQSSEATAGAAGPIEKEDFKPSEELKRLYREIAKKIHPDLAGDAKDQERRNRVMAEVNKAYAEGDIDRLRAILREWETSPDAVKGEGVPERLVRTIRKIHQARAGIERIVQEIDRLKNSDLAKLREAVEKAKGQGRDMLAEMAKRLDKEIEAARKALQELRESPRGV